MPARRADAARRNYAIDFSDFNDGIDWEHALPPNISEREPQQLSHTGPVRTTMFMEWPISENDFRVPDAVMRMRETSYRFMNSPSSQSRRTPRPTTSVQEMIFQEYEFQSGGGQMSATIRRHTELPSHSRISGQNVTQHHLGRDRTSGQRSGFSFLSDLASSMINNGQAEALFAPALNLMENAMSFAIASVGSGVVPTHQSREPRGSGEAGSSGGLLLSVGMDSRGPSPGAGERMGERAQPIHRRRHANRSSVEYDIIANFLGRIPLANDYRGGLAQRVEDIGWELGDFSYENLLQLDTGNKSVGLPQHKLRAMKPVSYANIQKQSGSAKNAARSNDDQAVCAICLEKLLSKDMVLDLGCGHVFHHSCIIKWLTRSTICPTCRREVSQSGRAQ